MKTIRIKRIVVDNFKAFRHEEFHVDSDIVCVYGRNESGKTTLVDAIYWCLFSKDHLYRTSFAIKTHDADGNEIPNLHHTVSILLSVDGIERTLTRSLKEKWTKPRGQADTVFSGNYQETLIDGAPVTVSDFQQYVSSIIPEDIFKAVTSPTYFLSLPWQDKRCLLSQMAGQISEAEITGGEQRFIPLLEALKKESLSDHLKHLRYQIRECKRKIDEIPVRLAEQNKALPEKQDWTAIDTQLRQEKYKLQQLIDKQASEATLTPAQRQRTQLRERIRQLEDIKRNREKAVNAAYQAKVSQQKKLYEQTAAKMLANNNDIASYNLAVATYKASVSASKAALADLQQQVVRIRTEWAKAQASTFIEPADAHYCDHCGAYLSDERYAEIKRQLLEKYNADKADRIADLRKQAAETKAKQQAAETDISINQTKIQQAEAEILRLTDENKLHAKVKAYPEEVYLDLLMSDEQYTAAEAEACDLDLQLKQLSDTSEPSEKPEPSEKTEDSEQTICQQRISQLTAQLAVRDLYNKISALIADIETDRTRYAQQLASLEQLEDTATEYQQRADDILESKVAAFFSLVRFKMFRTLQNGNREPYCECVYKGTEANNGLNSAAYIMAGVDICNGISRYYQVSAPVLIDNAEGINSQNFIPSEGQQIRLFVSTDDKLTIK